MDLDLIILDIQPRCPSTANIKLEEATVLLTRCLIDCNAHALQERNLVSIASTLRWSSRMIQLSERLLPAGGSRACKVFAKHKKQSGSRILMSFSPRMTPVLDPDASFVQNEQMLLLPYVRRKEWSETHEAWYEVQGPCTPLQSCFCAYNVGTIGDSPTTPNSEQKWSSVSLPLVVVMMRLSCWDAWQCRRSLFCGRGQ